jgi:predicted ribosomally synthesized peptide with SipW-like signal peptide
MTNRVSTKRALVLSLLSMLLCVSMLIGSTYAWFTDTATTAVNKIQSGTLDVALEMSTDNGATWTNAEGKTLNFMTADNRAEILWEPGCTYALPLLRVVNKGNLALKYKIMITGIKGNAKLNEAIEWTISDADLKAEHHLAAKAASEALTITGHMKDDAGNEYQGLSIDGISITVYATQDNVEKDSNGNDYDKDAEYNPAIVEDSEAAESELSKNEENIYVTLAGDVTFDVKPYDQKPMGGDKTKQIVIDGKGYKLTFNNTNSDWNNVTWGDAKLVIKNAVIDNSGYNADGGPWNSHDLYFNGDVEFENVVFTNAVALAGNATLKNVTISDVNATQDTYTLWICAGSNVTLENVTIDGTSAVGKDNRAIAVKDQYIDNPAETTLTVNGLTATSDKYAAIYVTSKSATTVNLNGTIDVTGTAVNDKFVQESSDSTGVVTINDHSTKVVKAASQEELKGALDTIESGKSAKLTIGEGIYTLYNVNNSKTQNTTLTIEGSGAENTTFGVGLKDGTLSGEYNGDYGFENSDVIFRDMTVSVGTGNYKGIIRAKSLYFENCTIVGMGSYWGVGTVVFKNCKFADNGDYNLWTYAGTDFTFENCDFYSSIGKFINAYKEQRVDSKLTFTKCNFIYTGNGTASKPAVCLKSYTGIAWDVTFTDCTSNAKTDDGTGSNLYSIESGMNADTTVVINGVTVWENGAKK